MDSIQEKSQSYVTPEFQTVSWVSPEAEAYWKHRIEKLSAFWLELELVSLKTEIRDYAVQLITPADLPNFSKHCGKLGLKFAILEHHGQYLRVVACNEFPIHDFVDAFEKQNDKMLGLLLGYPECCIDKFIETWRVKGLKDTTIPMRVNVDQEATPQRNILLRNLGIRPVFHLPCSFTCDGTFRLAGQLIDLAMELGHEINNIYHILSWPIKFSSLHGVAEITTPIVKIRRNTDYHPFEEKINYHGTTYPHLGASGISFPFQIMRHTLNVIRDTWTDNGFSSKEAMEKGHDLILKNIEPFLRDNNPTPLIDLGCGNGQLLRRIVEEYPNVVPFGVDSSPEKITKAKNFVPRGEFKVADVTRMEFDKKYDIGLVSRNRIEEASRSGNEHFERQLMGSIHKTLIYSYEDMNARVLYDEYYQKHQKK